MSKKKIGLIVAIVVVLFASLAGAYVIMHNDIGDDRIAASESPANVNDGLLGFVNTFYAAYYAAPADGASAADSAKSALARYGTSKAVASFTAQQKACFQNMPGSVTADDVASLQNPFRVNVTYNFTEDPTSAVVTVVNQDGTLKIDGVEC